MIQVLINTRIFGHKQQQAYKNVRINRGIVTFPSPSEPAAPDDATIWDLNGGWLGPGFIDLQVNGGGGVLFNADPTPEGLAQLVAAHRGLGTGGVLATVITDAPDVRCAAAAAVCAQLRAGLPGLLGIHFEGPFINPAKAGVHDPRHIQKPDGDALAQVAGLAQDVRRAGGVALLTLAPEIMAARDIAALAGQGIVLAAGHSAATYEQAMAGFQAGIAGVTHLFNAMSSLESRAPGLVGAALDCPHVWCGIIADGFHVHPAALRLALRAKGAGKLVLVSDAMACAGGPPEFVLYGQTIRSEGGRLVDAAGRLAGADLTLATAVRNMVQRFGVSPADAAIMASAAPAAALGLTGGSIGGGMASIGRDLIVSGAPADLIWLDADLIPQGGWGGGEFFSCDAMPLPKAGPDGV